MPEAKLSTNLRKPTPGVCIIDLEGEVTGFAENTLMAAYTAASDDSAHTIILNFSQLDYMNSSGIGLLVTLLISRSAPEAEPACLRAYRSLPPDFRAHPPQ